MKKSRTLEQVLSNIVVADNGCWRWQGPIQKEGYGQLSFESTRHLAHRFFYAQANPTVDIDGLVLDHECHNLDVTCYNKREKCLHRRCVNPSHLAPKTQRVHVADTVAARTHCPNNHEYAVVGIRDSGGKRICIACLVVTKTSPAYKAKNIERCATHYKAQRKSPEAVAAERQRQRDSYRRKALEKGYEPRINKNRK